MRIEFRATNCPQLEAQLIALLGQQTQAVEVFRRRLELIRAAPSAASLFALRSVNLRSAGDEAGKFVMPLSDAVGVTIEFSDEGTEPAAIVSGVNEYEKA